MFLLSVLDRSWTVEGPGYGFGTLGAGAIPDSDLDLISRFEGGHFGQFWPAGAGGDAGAVIKNHENLINFLIMV